MKSVFQTPDLMSVRIFTKLLVLLNQVLQSQLTGHTCKFYVLRVRILPHLAEFTTPHSKVIPQRRGNNTYLEEKSLEFLGTHQMTRLV